jgi:hypothetical protein
MSRTQALWRRLWGLARRAMYSGYACTICGRRSRYAAVTCARRTRQRRIVRGSARASRKQPRVLLADTTRVIVAGRRARGDGVGARDGHARCALALGRRLVALCVVASVAVAARERHLSATARCHEKIDVARAARTPEHHGHRPSSGTTPPRLAP